MAQLNFPQDRTELTPPGTGPLETGDTYTANGTTWVYNADAGAWGSGGGETSSDIFLSRVNDDTAEGAITFEKLTTHKAGVDVVNAVINNDGSAEFAGDITFKGWESNTDGGAKIVSGGFIQAKRSSGSALNTAIVWGGGHADGSQPMNTTSQIFADGSAEFAGGGMAINNAGRIQVKRNDGVDASLVFLVKDSSDNDSISMRGNGSSSFAGTVDIGNRDTGSASGSGHRLFTNSTYSALRTQVSSSATDQTIVYQVDRGTDTNKIQFTAGGSATFAGRIESKGSGSSSVFVTRDVTTGDEKGVYLFRGSRNINGGATENVFFINQDGSGSFAGGSCTVASSGRINIDRAEGQQYCFTTGYDGNTEQAHISGNGAIYSSYGLAVGGPGTTQGAGNAVINADGSAEFAGGEVTIFSSGSLRTNGQIYVSDKTTLSSDGSATFNGGNLALQEIGDKSVISLRKDGDNLVHFGATDTQGVLGIDYRSASFQNGTEVIKLNGDTGSAAFAGDVTTSVSGLTGPGFLEMRKEGNIRQRYDGSPDNKYAHALYSLGTNKDELNYILRSDGNIEIGGNLDVSRELSNPNISLRATDGSATFAGGVQFKLAGDGAGTTDSLLLDDYEEGRFTPTFGSDNAGFTATYADGGQVGRYTKIGNIVHCEVYIRLLSTNKLGTGLTINGLPYLSINSSNYGGGPVSVRAGFGSRWPNSGARLNPGANQVILEYDDGSQTTSQVRPQDLTDSSRINFCITYTAP